MSAAEPPWLDRLNAFLEAQDPRLPKFDDIRHAILDSDGDLDREVRRAAFAGEEVPEPLRAYVEKVRVHAYKVTEEDLEELRRGGYSDEQIFELTVATAVGAGFKRLHAGLRALGEVS